MREDRRGRLVTAHGCGRHHKLKYSGHSEYRHHNMRLLCLVFLTFLGFTKAGKGLDVSRLMFQFDLECFKEKGYEFVVIRTYRTCFPDPDGSDTIIKANKAGFESIAIYMSPCPGGDKPATDQVDEMMKALPQNISIYQIWLEVQYPGNWIGNHTLNQKFFEELLSSARKQKLTGVLTSESQWEGVMGKNYTGGSSYPLWYMAYDNEPLMNDFKPFGGWNKPAMKRYSQDSKECVGNLHLDYTVT